MYEIPIFRWRFKIFVVHSKWIWLEWVRCVHFKYIYFSIVIDLTLHRLRLNWITICSFVLIVLSMCFCLLSCHVNIVAVFGPQLKMRECYFTLNECQILTDSTANIYSTSVFGYRNLWGRENGTAERLKYEKNVVKFGELIMRKYLMM